MLSGGHLIGTDGNCASRVLMLRIRADAADAADANTLRLGNTFCGRFRAPFDFDLDLVLLLT